MGNHRCCCCCMKGPAEAAGKLAEATTASHTHTHSLPVYLHLQSLPTHLHPCCHLCTVVAVAGATGAGAAALHQLLLMLLLSLVFLCVSSSPLPSPLAVINTASLRHDTRHHEKTTNRVRGSPLLTATLARHPHSACPWYPHTVPPSELLVLTAGPGLRQGPSRCRCCSFCMWRGSLLLLLLRRRRLS